MIAIKAKPQHWTPEQVFIVSSLVVNAGNYLYNILLGRMLVPEQFAEAALFVTLLLVLSFVAMTFQLGVTRFVAMYKEESGSLIQWIRRRALIFGLCIGISLVVFSNELQVLFQTESPLGFQVFGVSLPIYFLMSIRRGVAQGNQNFNRLSGSYQLEMWTRLLVTFILIWMLRDDPLLAVVTGIGFSFVAGLYPNKKTSIQKRIKLSPELKMQLRTFLWFTALYEGTQILCNNSDILLVKHYFEAHDAGLYSSLALVGRVIYFASWMLIMLLLPKLIDAKKQNRDTKKLFRSYLGMIVILISILLSASFIMPETIVSLLFGANYISIAPYLGYYALATSLFALTNLFAYYFMSLDRFVPIILSAVFGALQIVGIVLFHDSFGEVIGVQVVLMGILLILQVVYYQGNREPQKSLIEG